jgi:hypothetical protein
MLTQPASGWRDVRIGARLLFWSLAVEGALELLMPLLWRLIEIFGFPVHSGNAFETFGTLLDLSYLPSEVLAVVAMTHLASAPPETRLRGFAWGAFWCALASLLVGAAQTVAGHALHSPGLHHVLFIARVFVEAAAWGLALWTLAGAARAKGRPLSTELATIAAVAYALRYAYWLAAILHFGLQRFLSGFTGSMIYAVVTAAEIAVFALVALSAAR